MVFEGEPEEYHYNPIGMVHGGFAATILDSAMGCAVHTTLPARVAYTTLEIKVNFVRPVKTSTGVVRAVGTVLHAGRTTSLAEGRRGRRRDPVRPRLDDLPHLPVRRGPRPLVISD